MAKKRVVIICGGPSNEHEVSLRSAAQVKNAIPLEKFETKLIKIPRDKPWYPRQSLKTYDIAFVAMHGKFGEDGRVQMLLETAGVPYTGSGVLPSAIGMNKQKTNSLAEHAGINVPPSIVVRNMPDQKQFDLWAKKTERSIGYPMVVKPNESGSSVGVTIIRSPQNLRQAMRNAFKEDRQIMIQKFITGRELTCGVIGNTGQTELRPLPPVEIISDRDFFDYEAKYNSPGTQEICPARIPGKITREIQRLAAKVHAVIGCDGLTRSDFILDRKNHLWFLEINTIPGLTEASLCPKEARAAGIPFKEFIEMQINLGLKRHQES